MAKALWDWHKILQGRSVISAEMCRDVYLVMQMPKIVGTVVNAEL